MPKNWYRKSYTKFSSRHFVFCQSQYNRILCAAGFMSVWNLEFIKVLQPLFTQILYIHCQTGFWKKFSKGRFKLIEISSENRKWYNLYDINDIWIKSDSLKVSVESLLSNFLQPKCHQPQPQVSTCNFYFFFWS